MIELLTYYVIGGALLVGAPAVFFLIAFMPALMNTKGRMVGYKDHKDLRLISLPMRTHHQIKLNFIWCYLNDYNNINCSTERLL